MHSFSQVGSWMGGGVMKITLSADTPAETRSLAISFRFSENSCNGTCCWGFLSAGQEQRKGGWFAQINHIFTFVYFRSTRKRHRTVLHGQCLKYGPMFHCKCIVPSSAQSLAPKNTVTATMLLSALFWLLRRRGRIILAHLELYPDSPLFTTSHFLKTTHNIRLSYFSILSLLNNKCINDRRHKLLTSLVCRQFLPPSHSSGMKTERSKCNFLNYKVRLAG